MVNTNENRRGWWLTTILLLLFAMLRLPAIMRFPIFIDEVVHARWAVDVHNLSPLLGAVHGKLFGLWWMALFVEDGDQAVFLARAATALFSLLGAALIYRVGTLLSGQEAGWLALLLYAVHPYGVFYDRMALVDPYVLPFALSSIWFCVRWLRHGQRLNAAAAGLCLTGAVLSKATGIVLVALPMLALLLLPSPRTWVERLRGLWWSMGTFALTGGAMYALLRWRGYDYFNIATTVVGTSATDTLGMRILNNIDALWTVDAMYFSAPFLVAAGICAFALLWLRPRVGAFLLFALLVPLGGLLAFAARMNSRYFQFHTPFLILLLAVSVHALILRFPNMRRYLVGLVLLWCVSFAFPFFIRYLNEPGTLNLPRLEREEYISGDSSGFALAEIAAFLRTQAQTDSTGVVIGLIANCSALDSLLPAQLPLIVECPVLHHDGAHHRAVIERIRELQALEMPFWLVYEALPYTQLQGIDLPESASAIFHRPTGGVPIAVYHLN